MIQLNKRVNLVICQKSKVNDWVEHFKKYYKGVFVFDLTNKKDFNDFVYYPLMFEIFIGIINYELAFRRPELSKLTDFTLILDESSLIQNESAKRSKFILKKLQPDNHRQKSAYQHTVHSTSSLICSTLTGSFATIIFRTCLMLAFLIVI